MREIIYRGKRLDNGEWEYGFFVGRYDPLIEKDTIKYGGIDNGTVFFDPVKVDIKTLGEYTGLTDKNGTKIFEGDLCLCDRHINDRFDKHVFEIKFDPMRGFYGENFSEIEACEFCLCEIIGNIYDNPELLKGRTI